MKISNQNGFGLVWILALLAVIASAGIGYYVMRSNTDDNVMVDQVSPVDQPQASTEPQTSITPEAKPAGTTITTGESEFGQILFDGDNQAIYIFELEETSTAECYGDCAVAWPPVLTEGEPVASGGVNAELLGTTKRTDGSTQITYNGHPLYYYAHEGPGEAECHNIRTHGGLWWVMQPNGTRVI